MTEDERLELAILDDVIKTDVADMIDMSESYEELAQNLKLYFELTPEFYEEWQAAIEVNKKHNPELHEDKPEKTKVTVDIDYVSGYLRSGYLEAYLLKEDLEKLKQCLKQEDYREAEEILLDYGGIVVTKFEINDGGEPRWGTLKIE